MLADADPSWRGLKEVAPFLYVGSFPPPGRYEGATALVLCAQEKQPPASNYPGLHVIYAGIDDNPMRPLLPIEIERVQDASIRVANFMRQRRRVMCTCAMGLNRSGLVAALAMRRVYPTMSGDEAIKRVRAARGPWALSNPQFAAYVRAS